jgi:thioredoxin-related protein
MKALVSSGLAVVAAIVQSACSETNWETDFEKAKTAAAEKNVPILVDFSGSDWCGWCVKLNKEVFSTATFKQYAENNLVLLLLDFPRGKPQSEQQKTQNRQLMEQYGVQGFPTVILLDATGKELARTGYQAGGPDGYIEHLKSLLKK